MLSYYFNTFMYQNISLLILYHPSVHIYTFFVMIFTIFFRSLNLFLYKLAKHIASGEHFIIEMHIYSQAIFR